jgi:quinol-cytochrome oxidoreductase complex cytochrome b subunit
MFFANAGFVAYTMRFYSIISDCFVVLSYQSFQAQYSTKAAGTQAVQAFPAGQNRYSPAVYPKRIGRQV